MSTSKRVIVLSPLHYLAYVAAAFAAGLLIGFAAWGLS